MRRRVAVVKSELQTAALSDGQHRRQMRGGDTRRVLYVFSAYKRLRTPQEEGTCPTAHVITGQKEDELTGCLVKHDGCNNLLKKYKTLKEYKVANLTPIEAGCCRPPSECGYPAINASYYDLSFHPISSNKDCKLYENSKAIKCYSCDS